LLLDDGKGGRANEDALLVVRGEIGMGGAGLLFEFGEDVVVSGD